jgi:hypothetical protein
MRPLPPWALAVLVMTGIACFVRSTDAQSVAVPAPVQAELIAKVCGYDKNYPARAGAKAIVLVTFQASSVESSRVAAQMMAALQDVAQIGRTAHAEQLLPFSDVASLASACRERHASILYVAPGLEDQVPALATALDGTDLLTVAAVTHDVEHGIVLGFDIFEGRPKLLLNLTQARRQRVAFRPELVRLMTVIP